MAYPYISIHVYYNSVEQFTMLDVNKRTFECKIIYHTSATVSTEIPITDPLLVVRQYSNNAYYYTQSGKRYIEARYIGDAKFIALYPHPTIVDEFLTAEVTYRIYVRGDYPRLRFRYYNTDGDEQLKYFDIEKEKYEVKLYIALSSTEEIQVPIGTNTSNPTVRIFDNNGFLAVESSKLFLYTLKQGTVQINGYFDYCGESYQCLDEVLIYTPFFRKIYFDHLLNNYDRIQLSTNTKTRIMFDVLMEFLDILYSYYGDIDSANNLLSAKNKFLNVISISRGLSRNNLYADQPLEDVFNKLYRELLMNLLDLTQMRGTKLSYELFFGALGYDIEILEYWFDENGNLVEMNYENELDSTFYGYEEDGTPISDILLPQLDPRRNVVPGNANNRNNKSIYIRPSLTPKPDIYNPLAFTAQQQVLLRQYLDLLKPLHVKYLYEVLRYNLTLNNPDYLITLLEPLVAFAVANFVYLIGDYIDPAGVQTQMIPLPSYPTNIHGWAYWVPPPGLPDNVETTYYGPYDADQTRGACIEFLRPMLESFSLGATIEFKELLDIPIKYDDVYYYDNATLESIGIRYDMGVLVYDIVDPINLVTFRTQYLNEQSIHGSDTETIIANLMAAFNITRIICELIISLI